MISNRGSAPFSMTTANQAAPGVGLAEFDARWAAWVSRGRVHERLVRRKLVIWAGVFATVAAVAYAFLHS